MCSSLSGRRGTDRFSVRGSEVGSAGWRPGEGLFTSSSTMISVSTCYGPGPCWGLDVQKDSVSKAPAAVGPTV